MIQKKILVVGKIPPPYFGTSVWFETMRLANWPPGFQMLSFNNNIHQSMATVGGMGIQKVWLNLKLYLSYHKFVATNKPDLILIPISQSTLGFLKDSLFIRISKRHSKVLLILHGSNWLNWFQSSGAGIKKYVANTLKDTRGVIVLGQKLRCLFESFYNLQDIFVVPNGIDQLTLPKTNAKRTSVVITYLGNLQPAKGIVQIIESLVHLKDHTNISLRVIGEWRDATTQQYCENLVQSENLPVNFMGPLFGDKKISALSVSDIFIFTPNKPEGLPLVILEAMAVGLPVISTDQGAITEAVADGVNGYIVESNSPVMIAQKLTLLINNQELRDRMGKESERIFREKFTKEKMIEGFTKVFKTALA